MTTILLSENLCSIFHARFKRLREIIPNARAAQLIDYIILGWQTSSYKLKNSDQKWFMKEYKTLVAETGIPLSSLKRYLKDFKDAGLIETRQALYARTTDTKFEVKKGCYIVITPKLLNLLQSEKSSYENTVDKPENNKLIIKDNPQTNIKITAECIKFDKNELIEKPKMSSSNIRDLYPSLINIITESEITKTVDKSDEQRIDSVLQTIKKTLFNEIKEEISYEVKNLVFGTFINLVAKHKIFLSSPKQVVAEYLFALINYEYFLKDINCIKHRNNVLAKLLRTNSWKTPKGFYKHFYLGQNFKDKNEIREQSWLNIKENEIYNSTNLALIRDSRLTEVENRMASKAEEIRYLEESLCNLSSSEEIIKVKHQIEVSINEIHKLWAEQAEIEKLIDQERNQEEGRAMDIAVA